ncbi:hypothetical protein SII_0598 [Streptococcus intermedius C270]|nr:hypothetical protein SII_0598 [Streptococcus intermedius C270]
MLRKFPLATSKQTFELASTASLTCTIVYFEAGNNSSQPLFLYLSNFALAASARAVKAAVSLTAKSASILRFTSISANFRPCINCEYERPFIRAAALIRVIHNLRKSRFF